MLSESIYGYTAVTQFMINPQHLSNLPPWSKYYNTIKFSYGIVLLLFPVLQAVNLDHYCRSLKVLDAQLMRSYPSPATVRCVTQHDRPASNGHRSASQVMERIRSWQAKMVARHRSPRGCCGDDFLSYIINNAGVAWLRSVAHQREQSQDCTDVWRRFLFNTARIMKMVESLEELSTPTAKCRRLRGCILKQEIDCSEVYFDIDHDDVELIFITSVVKALFSDRN